MEDSKEFQKDTKTKTQQLLYPFGKLKQISRKSKSSHATQDKNRNDTFWDKNDHPSDIILPPSGWSLDGQDDEEKCYITKYALNVEWVG